MRWKNTPEALGDMARFTMHATWTRLRVAYPMIQAETPKIIFNKRLKTTAGRAFVESTPQYIDLSNELLWQYPEEFQKVIIPHEAAHLAAYTRFADSGHGKGWKLVMAYLGLPTDRCHNMTNSIHAARRNK